MAVRDSAHFIQNLGKVGYNIRGKSVLAIQCSCGWKHMSAFDGTKAGEDQTQEYLLERYESAHGGEHG